MSARNELPPERDRGAGRLGSTYFLGFFAVFALLVLWLRGTARLLVPVMIVGTVIYGLMRLVRAIRRPVD